MSVFYPVGSGAEPCSGAIQGANSSRSDYTSIKVGNKSQGKDTDAAISCDVTTITQTTASGLVNAYSQDGRTALDLGIPAVVGTAVNVISANKIAGTYGVIDASGNVAFTEKPYLTCFDPSGATYTLNTGDLDPECPDFVIRNKDERLCGTGPINSINSFDGYTSAVYANCWECFTGSVDECDVTITDVTLWDDQASVGSGNVSMLTGGKVQSANLDAESGLTTPKADNPAGQNK